MSCIFCKIVKGELPSYKVYEDENVLAFLDIAPVNQGHILVIPKKHYANLEEISNDDLCCLIKAVKKIGKALKQGLGIAGYNLQLNNDPAAGQVVPHIHFHVIPRKKGDGLKLWPQGEYREREAEKIAEKIKNGL
ncbi:HIT family protein [Candidatus Parcubacteria bacterium]|nr:HIT family protein [Candidatus Parcubacteria bacterium]